MTRPGKVVPGAVRGDCARCGTPCLRQTVGQRAALSVVADAAPLSLAAALALTTPDRLAWCAVQLCGAGVDLRWLYPATHPAGCPHGHVIDHACTAAAPARRQQGELW